LNNSKFQFNKTQDEDDIYDIPTFLRRQMD